MKTKMYMVDAPQGEITIGMQYGSVSFKNGQVMPESSMVKMYPQYFKEIPAVEKKKVETETETVAELLKTIETPKAEAPIKRKAGRPKKIK